MCIAETSSKIYEILKFPSSKVKHKLGYLIKLQAMRFCLLPLCLKLADRTHMEKK